MTRRVNQSRNLLAPLAEPFIRRISSTDARFRRRLARFGLWTAALLIAYSFMSGTYGLPRIIRLQLTKKSLAEANQQLTVELVDAVRTRGLLRSDRGYIEKIARKDFFMVYPDETIYRWRGR